MPPTLGRPFDSRPTAESYQPLRENPFTRVADQPLSTLGADVDTASYANVRRFLTQRQLPPADAVRVEELVNYFHYHDPAPNDPSPNNLATTDDAPFAVRLEQARCPWNSAHHLVRIGVQGRRVDERERPACNLVLLLDVSGSMQDARKLPLVKAGMQMLVPKLSERDRVAIVTYSDSARVALEPTPGHRGDAILAAVEALRADGSTNGAGGLELAYDLAARGFQPEGVNRVLLCSDGDFNVGITDRDQLVGLIREKAGRGIFLSVLGFGMGNLKDDRLEGLADHGNGFYAYIDQQREAYRVLAQQAVGTLVTIAKDVKLQVEFNPAKVQAYRLIGYENRALAARDFADDTKDAGEIGAGHAVTVLYEIVPAGGVATVGNEPLEYAPAAVAASEKPTALEKPVSTSPNLLTAKIRYKRPREDASQALRFPLVAEDRPLAEASSDFRFAAAVAAWGQRLRGSASLAGFGYDQIESLARPALGDDPRGERAEFLDLVRATGELGGR